MHQHAQNLLRDLADLFLTDVKVSNCLASLNDTITRARIAEVHDAHEKNFHWLLDPAVVSFPDWLRDTSSPQRPIYWIQRKPGSGKSTLMKFAMRDPRVTKLLAPNDTEQFSLAAFFFHDRGSEKQKTLNGMLQEVLLSILQQISALSRYVLSSYIALVRARRTRCLSWDFMSLKSALVSLFEQRNVKTRILLLLDALDEHQGDNDLLASPLKSRVDKFDNECARLKMCLASRSWTVFHQHFGNCPSFSIHDHTREHNTREDIKTYFRARLKPCGPQEMHQLGHNSMTPLADLVATRASGVFIWVRLVVDMLAKGLQDGTPQRTLEELVNKIPRELRDLSAEMLRRFEPEYSLEAFIMLQTALCSFEPLPLKSFMAILDINFAYRENGNYKDAVTLASNGMELLTSSHKSRLVSRSGGLLEVIQRDRNVPESEGLVVQFIHQTVKEYVQSASKNLGLSQIPSKILQNNGYDFLLRICARCHTKLVSWIQIYVFDYARCTAKKCKEEYGDSECSRLVSVIVNDVKDSMRPGLSGPINIKWFLAEQKGSFFTAVLSELEAQERPWEMQMVKLAVAMNFPEYFVHYPGIYQGLKVSRGLLHVAVAASHLDTGIQDADHEYTIRVLVRVGCDINEHDSWMLKHINTDRVIHEDKGVSPLAQTLIDANGFKEVRLKIARTLLDLGASTNPDIWLAPQRWDATEFIYPLQYCIRYESAAFVRLLLQHRASDDSCDGPFLLRLARIRQDADVVQILLDFGLGEFDGKETSHDLPYVQEALRIQSHIVAAPSGGLSTALFTRESDIERVRQATADSSRGVANDSSSTIDLADLRPHPHIFLPKSTGPGTHEGG